MNKFIKQQTVDQIGYIRLNRPQVYNALIPEMILELKDVLSSMEMDANVRAIIMDGEGNSFCAGADINWMKNSGLSNENQNLKDSQLLSDLFYQIHHFSKPVIAAVHGPIYGGGIGLMACCDVVVAKSNARFKFSEVRLGITPSTIMPYIAFRMGRQLAKLKVLTAELFDAKSAQKYHLVDYVDKQDALSYAINITQDIIKGSPEALTETKQLIDNITEISDHKELAETTVQSLMRIKKSNNAKEGLSAFIEKREPYWE